MRSRLLRPLLAAVCLCLLPHAGADAHPNARFYRGDVTVSTSWEGVIRLTGKLVIREGVTVTVEPGTEVLATYADQFYAGKAAAVTRRHERFEEAARLLPLLQKGGVTILAGTDAGFLNSFNYPGIGLHDELQILVKYGLTPQQALAASVVNGPKFLGKAADYGALTPGKAADFLLLDRNPLGDITATRAIRGVVLHGRYQDRRALDSLLAETAMRAAMPSEPRP